MSVPATETKPADVGLKREMGLIGATWASETSIIGSGWLFGSYFAAVAVGSAALIWAWVIGGVAVIILALVHAELGGMYPVSGGHGAVPAPRVRQRRRDLVRLLLLAAGGHRRADRVLRRVQYGQYWLTGKNPKIPTFLIYDPTTGNVTHWAS